MKSLLLFSSFLLFSFSLQAQPGPLIWEDNFNNGQLDTSKWSYETGTGVNGDWGTGQLDRATDRVENVSFEDNVEGAEDGCMVITTRKEFFIDRNYTSGRIISRGKSSWGPGHRIVARVFPRDVKHPGQGFAFWMMPDEIPEGWTYIMWPQGGEVDIMEYVGVIPYHNLGSVHYAWFWENNQWQSWNHGHQGAYYSYEHQEVPNPSEPGYGGYPPPAEAPYAGSSGFHTYGIDWYEDRMEFFVDDNVYHIHYFEDGGGFQVDGQDGFQVSPMNGKRVAQSEYAHHFPEWYPYEHKMFLILSAGVGGAQHTYGGPVEASSVFPCSVFIDWVKVYQLDLNTSIDRGTYTPEVKLFPNPGNERLHIEIDQPSTYDIRIHDLAGKQVIETPLDPTGIIDISGLKAGVYLVSFNNGQLSFSKKVQIH